MGYYWKKDYLDTKHNNSIQECRSNNSIQECKSNNSIQECRSNNSIQECKSNNKQTQSAEAHQDNMIKGGFTW